MTRTFCTVIGDEAADSVLSPMGEVFAAARHWSFKQIHVLHRPVAVVKREAQPRFCITARHFNGIRVDLDQAVNGWRGTAQFKVASLKDAVEATVERIATLGRQMLKAKTERRLASLHFKQVGKKQRLDVLRGRLAVAERELAEDRPRICFGGRALLRQDDVWAWRARRRSRIFLVGSKDETGGNQSIQWDGENLQIRLPGERGSVRTLTDVTFRYGQAELLRVLARNEDPATRAAMTWLLFQDEMGRWHAHVTVEEPVAPLVTDVRHGVIAVDLNVDHLAVVVVDYWGNPVARLALPFPVAGTDEGVVAAMIGDSVRALSVLARKRGYGIACEDLEFSKKKAGLREYGAAHARRLSGWSYARFFQVLAARCKRDGVDLCKVNPAFTSVIGRTKYARGRAMSVHHSAALVIGRRALGYAERLVTMDGAILDGPARNRPRTEWRRWRGVRRLTREVRPDGTPVRTARSGVGRALRGGPAGPASVTARAGVRQRGMGGMSTAKALADPSRRTCNVQHKRWAATPPDAAQVGDAVALASDGQG